jgi:hypothetical protein
MGSPAALSRYAGEVAMLGDDQLFDAADDAGVTHMVMPRMADIREEEAEVGR